MKILDKLLGKNPLDDIARSSLGLPKTIKGLLSTHLNPRPAGIVLRNCTTLLHTRSLDQLKILTDDGWAQEMRHNNGNFISVLLRHPTIAFSDTFIRLFDDLEVEYSAVINRVKWPSMSSNPERIASVFESLRPGLAGLAALFAEWATENRSIVWSALNDIATADQYQEGNAKQDIERLGVDWL